MTRKHVLFIGDDTHPEFRIASGWLAEHCRMSRAADAGQALRLLQCRESPPDILLVGQTRPAQFSRAAVESLHCAAPLARMVTLLGSWCEGEPRTGHPWPGVVRVYWHQFLSRCVPEIIRGTFDGWSLPRTSTESERALSAVASAPARRSGLIAVATSSVTAYDAIADVCAMAGYSAVWFGPRHQPCIRGPLAGIWDDATGGPDRSAISDFVAHLTGAPVVGLLSFPRRYDLEQLRSVGVRELLAKPYLVTELWAALDRAHPARRPDSLAA